MVRSAMVPAVRGVRQTGLLANATGTSTAAVEKKITWPERRAITERQIVEHLQRSTADPLPVSASETVLADLALSARRDVITDVRRRSESCSRLMRDLLLPLALEEWKLDLIARWSAASACEKTAPAIVAALEEAFTGIPGIDGVGDGGRLLEELSARALRPAARKRATCDESGCEGAGWCTSSPRPASRRAAQPTAGLQ